MSRQAERPSSSEAIVDPAPEKRRKPRDETEPAPQFGALPWRLTADGALEVLLISSRDTGRWIIPKGWPMAGRTGAEAAATEAFEEAGVRGVAEDTPIGAFDYRKCDKRRPDRWCRVSVFALRVEKQLADWPEKAERTLCWLPPEDAAARVDDGGLADLIRSFARRRAGPVGPA